MSPTCHTCGEEFVNLHDLIMHRQDDDCIKQVEQHVKIYEDRQLEQHQKDLEDYADWGND